MIRHRTILYDGGCGLCRRTIRVIRRLDWLGKTTMLDVVHDWPSVSRRYPYITREAALHDVHVASGDDEPLPGFDGYRSLARAIPVCWPIVPLLYLPGMLRLGWRVYRYIADHRSTTSCDLDYAGRSAN